MLPQPPAPFDHHVLKGKKILVAEDNEINRRIVEKLLSGWEADADPAENGLIAVTKASEKKYDLVLMDVHMPEMNGYEATHAIRNLEGTYYRDLPILALTATAFREDREQFLSSGMNGYIIKPFTPPELFEQISSFIKDERSDAT